MNKKADGMPGRGKGAWTKGRPDRWTSGQTNSADADAPSLPLHTKESIWRYVEKHMPQNKTNKSAMGITNVATIRKQSPLLTNDNTTAF